MKFKVDVLGQCLKLRLKFEIEGRSWNQKVQFKADVLGQCLKLRSKFEIEGRSWNRKFQFS